MILAFYEYDPITDIVTIATNLHQLEDYDLPTIGKSERSQNNPTLTNFCQRNVERCTQLGFALNAAGIW
jgi:hypothetical protein